MASSREYLQFVLERLSDLEDVSWRAMMGEYLLYVRQKVVGGIYDNRLLVKPTQSALALMPHAPRELPYEGGSELLLVERVEDSDFLVALFRALAEDLSAPKKRKP